MSIEEFLKLKGPVDHQTLLLQGKLIKVEEGEDRPIVFLSHTWVSFDSPDPHARQLAVFQQAVQAARDGCEISLSPLMKMYQATNKLFDHDASEDEHNLRAALKNGLVWYD